MKREREKRVPGTHTKCNMYNHESWFTIFRNVLNGFIDFFAPWNAELATTTTLFTSIQKRLSSFIDLRFVLLNFLFVRSFLLSFYHRCWCYCCYSFWIICHLFLISTSVLSVLDEVSHNHFMVFVISIEHFNRFNGWNKSLKQIHLWLKPDSYIPR